MPTVILAPSTGTGIQVVPANDTLSILLQGDVIASTDNNAIRTDTANDVEVSIAGTVIAEGNGIYLNTVTGTDNSVTIQSTGTVLAHDHTGVAVRGDNAVIRNFGFISSGGTGAAVFDDGAIVENYGTIASTSTDGTFGSAISTSGAGIDDLVIRNFGVLSSAATSATRATIFTIGAAGEVSLVNTGQINSGGVAVLDGSGLMNFENSGTVLGDVNLGAGADTYRGFGGTVIGTINGEAGDDTFYVDQVDVVIDGGADYDTVFARADFVSGGNIEQIVLRGADDISGTGDDGINYIQGRAGDNDIFGLGGNDSLRGGAGDDFLDGGGGRDTLRGDAGNDTLFGSLADDILLGGGGSDTFLFTSAAESGIGTDRDQIRDFTRGQDVIDISELSDPAFTFEGTGGLSGTGPSVAYFVNGNGHAIVEIDVNGDGVRDMQIAVFDNAVLSADDFIL